MTNPTEQDIEVNKIASVKRQKVRSSFLVSILGFALINLIIFQVYAPYRRHANAQDRLPEIVKAAKNRTFSWWTAKNYLDQPHTPDLVLIGSSQMASATFSADAQLLQKAVDVLKHRQGSKLESELEKVLGSKLNVFNCSQGGFMISDAYMMSRALFQQRRKPKLVILGIAPRDFMDNTFTEPSSSEPFQFYAQAVQLGKLANFSFADPIARLQWMASKELPLRWLKHDASKPRDENEGDAVVSDSKQRQCQIVQAICNTCGDLKPGLLLIPANIPRGLQDNTNEYENRYRQAYVPTYKQEMVFYKELLSFFKQSDIKVIVVAMPTLWTTREILPKEFWQNFLSTASTAARSQGASWIDLSNASAFEPDDFLDTVHLNAYGGAKLFNILAKSISSDEEIVACLKPTDGRQRVLAGTRLPEPTH